MAITETHTFGWMKEEELKPRLEDALGESITKTAGRFDSLDFFSDNWLVELKSRRAVDKYKKPVDSSSYPEWLVPTTKQSHDKDLVLFYYWEGDNSLWYIVYDEEEFNTFKKMRPFWHPQRQEHWLIPQSSWTRL